MLNSFPDNVADIITAAAISPLGIFALMIIVLSLVATRFFSNPDTSEKVRVVVFSMMFLGAVSFSVALFHQVPFSPSPDGSSNTPEGPVATQKEPATTQDKPDTTLTEPFAIQEEPVTAPEEPLATQEEPTTIPEEPFTIQEESTTTLEEPVTTQKEPATTQEGPATTLTEPFATQKEPATTQEEPTITPVDYKISIASRTVQNNGGPSTNNKNPIGVTITSWNKDTGEIDVEVDWRFKTTNEGGIYINEKDYQPHTIFTSPCLYGKSYQVHLVEPRPHDTNHIDSRLEYKIFSGYCG